MTFEEILDQAAAMLQRRGRVTYRALKAQFQLDDDLLETLKEEILYSQPQIVDDEGKGLIWTGESGTQPEPVSASPPDQPKQPAVQEDQPIQAEPPPTEPHTPDMAERRQLSVMFSDLVDSTKLSGQLDPEDYREVVRAYQATCSEVIHRFDGYIAQHLGDALLVYFGFPQAHDNDSQRAIHAGLGMLEAMRALNERLEQEKGIRLSIRVGIHTGLTVIGDVGSGQKHELLALGEAPNVASRIQGLAEPDTIAISDATYRLVEGYFTVEDLGLHSLKGVAEPQQVYRVLGESGVQSRLEIAATRGLTPLVGRESEVTLLLERWNQVKDGQGQVVLLNGEGGIGKSRLVQVIKEHVVEDRYPALNWTPQRQRQKTLESIVSILLEQAEHQPVFFIMEDLHWTDPSTLELLDLLINQTPTAAIFALLTCRPTFQPTWGLRTHVSPIAVNRLNHTQIEMMAERVAGGKTLPAEVLQRIVERTDGVPLFVEELTKALLESGHLKETNEHYELTGTLPALAIPATLQDSLMARLDRLVTAKAVAQYASVIGRQFSYELLQAVSQLDEPTLQRELGRLVEAELLYQRGLSPQATYLFKHALIQDAAYQSLLKSTRQQYHQRIVQVLEERFPEIIETQPELLAHHSTEAGRNEQAVLYWHQAGEKAIQRSANVEAIAHLRKGLELLKMLPETPERIHHELNVLLTLGPALMATKGYAASEVENTYARARALCQQMGQTPQLLMVLHGLWVLNLVRGELQTARELAEQPLALAQRQHDQAFLLKAHLSLGLTLLHLGAFPLALTHLEQGLALYNAQQQRSQALHAAEQDPGMQGLSYAARALWFLGYPDQALRKSHEALALAQEHSQPFSLSVALLAFAVITHELRREEQTVRELTEAGMTLSTEHGFTQVSALGTMRRGMVLTEQGRGAEGITQIRQGLAAYRATGAEIRRPYYLALLAEAYGTIGQPEEGLTVLAEALALVDKTGERWCEAELHRLRGELLLQQSPDNQTESETCFHQALSVARSQEAKSWELRAATSLARLWQSRDKRRDAYDLLAPVYN